MEKINFAAAGAGPRISVFGRGMFPVGGGIISSKNPWDNFMGMALKVK